MRTVVTAALIAVLSFACTTGGLRPAPTLAQLVEGHWQRELGQNAVVRSELGLPVERLPDTTARS